MRLPAFLLATLVGGAAVTTFTGCGGTEVNRVESREVKDLSGKWNDIDSQQVSDAMIADVLQRPWHTEHRTANGGAKPVVKVGNIVVRSNGDVISTEIFTNDVIRAFINSGQVRAVRAVGNEWQTRNEIKSQDKYATPESRKAAFAELGCDYLMTGVINVQDDQEGRQSVKFYSVDLTLEQVQTGELVWMGNKKIKKFIERAR
jgi:hypothetical protein